MNLSFKDFKFIIEALEHLLSKYNYRLKEIEDLEEYEDEASDLNNDYLFLESLTLEIKQNLNQNELTDVSDSPTLESVIGSASKLSINERLLLVEAITQSIRKETDLIAS